MVVFSFYCSILDFSPGMLYTDYVFYTHKIDWNSARDVCRGRGGELAKIDSPRMLKNLQEMGVELGFNNGEL